MDKYSLVITLFFCFNDADVRLSQRILARDPGGLLDALMTTEKDVFQRAMYSQLMQST